MVYDNFSILSKDDSFSYEKKLGEWAAKIAYYNFQWRFDTLVVFNILHMVALDIFLIKYKEAVVIKRGKYIPEKRPKWRLAYRNSLYFAKTQTKSQICCSGSWYQTTIIRLTT